MTPDAIDRVKASYDALARDALALSSRFYEEMFRAAPKLRPLFPQDLLALQGHFEAALSLVVRNLHEMSALAQPLRDLGAAHVGWGARPDDYLVAREALIAAIRSRSAAWDERLEHDWRAAITGIIVPMLEGAAVDTAVAAWGVPRLHKRGTCASKVDPRAALSRARACRMPVHDTNATTGL